MWRLLCALSMVISVRAASAPFIKPCSKTDTECLKASTQAAVPVVARGVPELGIKPLDPLHLAVINGDQNGLKLTLRDSDITGMKNCVVEGIKQDLKKGKQVLTIRCSVELQGDYKLGGRLILFPIQGEGKYNIKIQDIIIKAYFDLETVEGQGGTHWHISNWRHGYQVKTGAQFKFNNLFNGNKVLAAPIQQFVNTSWQEVMQEVAPPIVKAIVSAVIDAVQALYTAVPANQLFIE